MGIRRLGAARLAAIALLAALLTVTSISHAASPPPSGPPEKLGEYTYISVTVTVNDKVFHSEGNHRVGFKAETDSMRYLVALPKGTTATICKDIKLTERTIFRGADGKRSEVPIESSTRTTHSCWTLHR